MIAGQTLDSSCLHVQISPPLSLAMNGCPPGTEDIVTMGHTWVVCLKGHISRTLRHQRHVTLVSPGKSGILSYHVAETDHLQESQRRKQSCGTWGHSWGTSSCGEEPWRSEQLLGEVTDGHCPPSSGPGDHLCVCEVDSQFCQLARGGVQSDTAQQGLPASIQMLIVFSYIPRCWEELRIHIPFWNGGFLLLRSF